MVMEPSTTVEAMSQDTEGVFCPKSLDLHTGSYNYENVPCSFLIGVLTPNVQFHKCHVGSARVRNLVCCRMSGDLEIHCALH